MKYASLRDSDPNRRSIGCRTFYPLSPQTFPSRTSLRLTSLKSQIFTNLIPNPPTISAGPRHGQAGEGCTCPPPGKFTAHDVDNLVPFRSFSAVYTVNNTRMLLVVLLIISGLLTNVV